MLVGLLRPSKELCSECRRLWLLGSAAVSGMITAGESMSATTLDAIAKPLISADGREGGGSPIGVPGHAVESRAWRVAVTQAFGTEVFGWPVPHQSCFSV